MQSTAPVLRQPTIIHARLRSAKQHLRHVPGSEPATFLACSPRLAKLPPRAEYGAPLLARLHIMSATTWPHGPSLVGGIVVSKHTIQVLGITLTGANLAARGSPAIWRIEHGTEPVSSGLRLILFLLVLAPTYSRVADDLGRSERDERGERDVGTSAGTFFSLYETLGTHENWPYAGRDELVMPPNKPRTTGQSLTPESISRQRKDSQPRVTPSVLQEAYQPASC